MQCLKANAQTLLIKRHGGEEKAGCFRDGAILVLDIKTKVMDKKNESLVDDPTGKIILNESGTSVSADDIDESGVSKKDTGVDDAVKEDALGNKTVTGDNTKW